MSQHSSEHIAAPEIKKGFGNLSVCLRRGSCQSGWTQGEDTDTVKQSKQAPWLTAGMAELGVCSGGWVQSSALASHVWPGTGRA